MSFPMGPERRRAHREAAARRAWVAAAHDPEPARSLSTKADLSHAGPRAAHSTHMTLGFSLSTALSTLVAG